MQMSENAPKKVVTALLWLALLKRLILIITLNVLTL